MRKFLVFLLKKRYDYFPFGMLLPNRHGNTSDYRYGFNGKELDNEVKGEGNSYDFGARIYDPRIGRFLSIDPKWRNFESSSPYNFAHNNPMIFVDRDGEDPFFFLIAKFGVSTVRYFFTSRKAALRAANEKDISDQKRRNIMNGIGILDGMLSTIDIAEMEQTQKEMMSRAWETFMEAEFDTFNQLSQEELERTILGPEGMAIKEQAEQIVFIIDNWEELDPYTQGQVKGVIYGTLAQIAITKRATIRLPKTFIPKLAKKYKLRLKATLDLKKVRKHLKRFGKKAENEVMLERRKKINRGELEATEVDDNFMKHELRERELMKNGATYEDAHIQTLKEQGMYHRGYEERLYTPEAIEAGNKQLIKEAGSGGN